MKKSLVLIVSVVLPAMAFGADGNIGIFHNGQPVCGVEIPCAGSITLEVYALLEGATAGGIIGAEYSLAFGPISVTSGGTTEDLAPDGLTVVEIPNLSATTILGSAATPPDPSPRGTNIAWSTCQTGDGTKVLLATLIVLNTGCSAGGTPTEVEVHVIRHDSPSNLFFPCPLFTMCDGPVFTKVCLGDNLISCEVPVPPFPQIATCSSSGELYLNPEPASCGIEGVIDIEPGSDPNSINLRSKGLVPVAILTTSTADGDTQDFDAWTVDPLTLTFGPDGAAIAHSSAHAEDVDGDGDLDMVVHFRTQETGIACGDATATLTGETYDGVPFVGADAVRTVGCN